MKYYQRHLKIMPTTNKKNNPLNKLLSNDTGDSYDQIKSESWLNDISHLYKYSDRFIQTDNVIILNDYGDFVLKLKTIGNTTFIGDTLYEKSYGYRNGITHVSVYDKNTPPDPFDFYQHRYNNIQKVKTSYLKSHKEEIFIGLYKYNEATRKYDYLPNSFYDKNKQMYYLFE